MFKAVWSMALSLSLISQSVFAAGVRLKCYDALQNKPADVTAEWFRLKPLIGEGTEVLKMGGNVRIENIIDQKSEILFGFESAISAEYKTLLIYVGDRVIRIKNFGSSFTIEPSGKVANGVYLSGDFGKVIVDDALTQIEALAAIAQVRDQSKSAYAPEQMKTDLDSLLKILFMRLEADHGQLRFAHSSLVQPVVVGDIKKSEIKYGLKDLKERSSPQAEAVGDLSKLVLQIGVPLAGVILAFGMLSSCVKELERSGLFQF